MKAITLQLVTTKKAMSALGFSRIVLQERYLSSTRQRTMSKQEPTSPWVNGDIAVFYDYSWLATADGELITLAEDEIMEEIAMGCYKRASGKVTLKAKNH